MELSKAWDWSKNEDRIWFEPCEESYYLINRWEGKGFTSFLDLGCGPGRHSIQFAREGFAVSAVDLSEEAVSSLQQWSRREGLGIQAELIDMVSLPFRDNAFDCLFAYHVISHTDSRGIKKIIAELNRVLREKGEFFITLCSKKAWSYREAGYPPIDENTVLKTEDGVEKDVPHFYVDEDSVRQLFAEMRLISVRQIQDVVVNGSDYGSWHYFILGEKKAVQPGRDKLP